jgi:hypothetical protein
MVLSFVAEDDMNLYVKENRTNVSVVIFNAAWENVMENVFLS